MNESERMHNVNAGDRYFYYDTSLIILIEKGLHWSPASDQEFCYTAKWMDCKGPMSFHSIEWRESELQKFVNNHCIKIIDDKHLLMLQLKYGNNS
jgi:hypothetical protein